MRSSTFQSVARVAVKELLEQHMTASRFGYIVTEEGVDDICEDIVRFLQTSRSLKEAGDRLISQGVRDESLMQPKFAGSKQKRWM